MVWMVSSLLTFSNAWAKEPVTQNPGELSKMLNQVSRINDPVCVDDESLVDCEAKIEQFCKELYDPHNPKGSGNLDLKIGVETMPMRLGIDSNDNSFTSLALSQARIKNSADFPPHFKKYLDQYGYFKKHKAMLDTGIGSTLEEKRKLRELASESSKAWNDAFSDAVDDELNAKHPNFQAVKPMPPRWQVEQAEIVEKLEMGIAKATWEHTSAWEKVQSQFKEVQKAYLTELEQSTDIPKELKKVWADRINTIQLKIPGTESYMLDDSDCSSTELNATYFPAHHTFTVCAGTFNSSDFLLVMAHELAHSIGESRDLYLAETSSPIAREFHSLARSLCEHQPAGCSSTWTQIKKDLSGPKALLKPLTEYTSQSSKLRACLQYHSPNRNDKKQASVVVQAAAGYAHNHRSDLASRGFFLNSVKTTSINEKGKEVENLGYLNPCSGKAFKSEQHHFANALPTFYLAEYQCLSSLPPEQRMAESIKTAEAMQKAINEKLIPMGGPFSSNPIMIQNDFSSDSEERFADWVGSRVMARMVTARNLDPKSRVNLMAANISLFCDPPSNEVRYASEAQIQKEFDDEPHSLNGTRRMELLTPAIRTALGCKLPIKPGKECKF